MLLLQHLPAPELASLTPAGPLLPFASSVHIASAALSAGPSEDMYKP
jgi:hypothetical protein